MLAVFFVPATANAMTSNELLAKLTADYQINGYTYHLTDGAKVLAERYLNQNPVSSTDADYIAGKIDEAVAAMRNSGVSDFSDLSKLPASLKATLKQLVQDIAANTSVKVTVINGRVIIYNADGSVFAELSGFEVENNSGNNSGSSSSSNKSGINNSVVKNTGANVDIVAASALLITALGSAFVVKNIKENANA